MAQFFVYPVAPASGRAMGRIVALLLWLASWVAIEAAESRRKSYALAADDAPQALNRFAEQSGEQVIYLLNQVKGVRTNSVKGRYTAREAIERMISDTVLRVVADQQTGAFLIQRIAAPEPSPQPDDKKTQPKTKREAQ